MDIGRILQVFLVQLVVLLFFLYFGIKTIKRKEKIYIYFSLFFFLNCIAFTLNMIYAFLFDENLVLLLNLFTNFFIIFSLIFLLITNLNLYIRNFKTLYSFFIILAHAFFSLVIFFIPNGVTINAETEWKPKWSFSFFIYVSIIVSVVLFLINYTNLLLYNEISTKSFKKKWIKYLIGINGLFVLMFGSFISNLLNINTFRIIWSIISLTAFLFTYLVYSGFKTTNIKSEK